MIQNRRRYSPERTPRNEQMLSSNERTIMKEMRLTGLDGKSAVMAAEILTAALATEGWAVLVLSTVDAC
jgi:hypothetical protein